MWHVRVHVQVGCLTSSRTPPDMWFVVLQVIPGYALPYYGEKMFLALWGILTFSESSLLQIVIKLLVIWPVLVGIRRR